MMTVPVGNKKPNSIRPIHPSLKARDFVKIRSNAAGDCLSDMKNAHGRVEPSLKCNSLAINGYSVISGIKPTYMIPARCLPIED
jgi:hypothetical protein